MDRQILKSLACNGGSAVDGEHIAGELMKRFKSRRPVPVEFAEKLRVVAHMRGEELVKNSECGLMAIQLVAHEAVSTAFSNDVDGLKYLHSSSMGSAGQVEYSGAFSITSPAIGNLYSE